MEASRGGSCEEPRNPRLQENRVHVWGPLEMAPCAGGGGPHGGRPVSAWAAGLGDTSRIGGEADCSATPEKLSVTFGGTEKRRV